MDAATLLQAARKLRRDPSTSDFTHAFLEALEPFLEDIADPHRVIDHRTNPKRAITPVGKAHDP